eukprot:scaffold6844_cov357-Prasinococcus_capsulatus_cf.AAC.3
MTVSGVGHCRQVGCPESGVEEAVSKLVQRGYKVGRIEQLESSQDAKKRGASAVVRRALGSIETPATFNPTHSATPEAVHLLAICEQHDVAHGSSGSQCREHQVICFAFLEATAGKMYVGTLEDDLSRSGLSALLAQVAPREILYCKDRLSAESLKALKGFSHRGSHQVTTLTYLREDEFPSPVDAPLRLHRAGFLNPEDARELDAVKDVGEVHTSFVMSAMGALASHLERLNTESQLLRRVTVLPYSVFTGSLRLDGPTLFNLELIENNIDGGEKGSLLSYVDRTVTPYGKRLLRRWLCHPLRNAAMINARLDAVEELLGNPGLHQYCCRTLRLVSPDAERAIGRLKRLSGNGSQLEPTMAAARYASRLKALGIAVTSVHKLWEALKKVLRGSDASTVESHLLKQKVAVADSGHSVGEYAAAAMEDTLHALVSTRDKKSGDSFQLRAAMGLKLSEPDHLRQAEEELCRQLEVFLNFEGYWTQLVDAAAHVDVICSFASVAGTDLGSYCRPEFVQATHGAVLNLQGVWNPCVNAADDRIVPNDVELSRARTILLTGPNMGGKSTLLRSTCLAVILAQMGCYVPAQRAVLSPVDTIFTRLGASDRIMSGESTFMVECRETASILRSATANSLVILDELGRGTATFDGYAVAYAVLRHLTERVNCRMLFATHYHPLTQDLCTCHMPYARRDVRLSERVPVQA